MNRKFLISIIYTACAVLGFGCSQTCKDRGECECATRFDCSEGQICMDGACKEDDSSLWIIPTHKFGEVCTSSRECTDGICLPLGPDNGGVCTISCEDNAGCSEGWECKTWFGDASAAQRVCVQKTHSRLCLPCTVNGHCNATGDLCYGLKEGMTCLQDCANASCPTGYTCESVEQNGQMFMQCVPIDGSCECGPGKDGMGQSCTKENDYGVCSGWKYCGLKGNAFEWSQCDAQTPAREICDGIDNDCDGLTDGFDPSLFHDGISDPDNIYPLCYLGGCVGRWQCGADEKGDYGWHCDAGDPEREICNGVDDNCNGAIDESFVNADGLYVDDEHCGSCGTSCRQTLANLRKDEKTGEVLPGAAKCEVRDTQAVCVPVQCESGYYPYPHDAPVSCVKLESPACEVCGADSDCRVYTDRCMTLSGDFGTHCMQSCSENSPYECSGRIGEQGCCPKGYTCQLYENEKLCIPRGESCTCDASKKGMVRNCAVSSGTDICQGRQECQQIDGDAYAWSPCSAESLTVEVCDGQDNNCNGEVDEGFVDDKGRYNVPEHCGECNNDCPSRWKAPELHAEGACLLNGDNYACQFTGCKTELNILGKRCLEDQDCGKGMKCDRQVFYCVGDGTDTPRVSCSSDESCASISGAHRCSDGVCKVNMQYRDLNGIAADGCECGYAIDGGIDEPEIFNHYPTETSTYADRDCDGIDGAEVTSLFVSSQSLNSIGTRANPFKTIAEAVKAYQPLKHTAILVAAGTYYEQVTLNSGIRLFGGYSSDFSTRNIVLNPTIISAPVPASDAHPGSVYIPAVNRRTTVSGFTIKGYDVDESMAETGLRGRNTYAVYIESSSSLITIANNIIEAGRGGDGGRGAAGESGYAGSDGQRGQNSRECSSTTCAGETTPGGSGGTNKYCKASNGNPGAAARDGYQRQEFSDFGINGLGGDNNSYSSDGHPEYASYCKYDCMAGGYSNGGNGQDGANGTSGGGGTGCTQNVGGLSGLIWAGSTGTSGRTGGAAGGGGGGGAGGAAINYNNITCTEGNLLGDIGGSGGGGGAGGCGGIGGGTGGAGGGSFGIWIAKSELNTSIFANIIMLGIGGSGGNGGDGGAGGHGGRGGVGGENLAPAWCSGPGGSGGSGGDGGSGGGGGGGCGGVSIGIAGVGISTAFDSNRFEFPEGNPDSAAGKGGRGGNSPAGSESVGDDGANGFTAHVHSF